MAPWQYCCFFLLLLSEMWALLRSAAISKTAMSTPGNFLFSSQIQLWAQKGAFKCSFPISKEGDSRRKWSTWCVSGCRQAAWGETCCQQSVSQPAGQSGHVQEIISFLYLSEGSLLHSPELHSGRKVCKPLLLLTWVDQIYPVASRQMRRKQKCLHTWTPLIFLAKVHRGMLRGSKLMPRPW